MKLLNKLKSFKKSIVPFKKDLKDPLQKASDEEHIGQKRGILGLFKKVRRVFCRDINTQLKLKFKRVSDGATLIDADGVTPGGKDVSDVLGSERMEPDIQRIYDHYHDHGKSEWCAHYSPHDYFVLFE